MITPTDKIKPFLKELDGYLKQIDDCMSVQIDNDLNLLTAQLSKSLTLLSLQGRVMEIAGGVYDWAKGQSVELCKADDLKHELLKNKLSGLLSNYSSKFDRAERTVKALTAYIDGLRTLISAEKELTKNL